MKIILGSGSAYRKQAMTEMGYDFEVVTADIDEKAIRYDDPEELTLALSKAKAEAIIPKLTEPAILITSDQVVVCNGIIREKPVDEQEARLFLESYATYPAETVTAVTVTNTATGQQESAIDWGRDYLNPLPKSVIDELISSGKVFHWAGAFAIEDPSTFPFIDHFESTLDSIGGLPKDVTKQLIAQVGGQRD